MMDYEKNNMHIAGIVGVIFILIHQSSATDFDFRGQLSAFGNVVKNQNQWNGEAGILYLPQFNAVFNFNTDSFADTEISFKGFIITDFENRNQNVDFYRLKFRYATAQSETRIGLQKISFGPAILLRSLMWFDRVDVRDPLGLTNGVYALRYIFNFLNNANIWLWGLYGNEKRKGYEVFSTTGKTPEFGGRFQFPISFGEIGQSFHYRKAEAGKFKYNEYRMGVDGRWDTIIGIWLESVFTYNQTDKLPFQWTKMITFGADYTFGIGNGLYFLTEHLVSAASDVFFPFDDDSYTSAFMLSYPMGIFDNIRAIGFFTHDDNKFYQFLDWQRTYDEIMVNLSLFYYPESQSYNLNVQTNGYGAQIMIIYNH
jgi:hypothetical protein